MREIRIATRASKLALAQANQIAGLFHSLYPEYPVSMVEISTKGDRDKSDFLYKSGMIGFFTSEVEKALLDRQADIAVHSLKDLPTAITEGLIISAVPKREAVSDVIVTAMEITSVQDLPERASVGTSSFRRITQLKLLRPDVDCRPMRGNVETRIRQVTENRIDAVVIAQAGLNRLGLSDHISLVLPPKEFLPAPGQGALAVQTRQEDDELGRLVSKFEDPNTRLTTQVERRILAGLHGGCSIPLGVYAYIEKETICIHAVLCNPDATRQIRKSALCRVDRALETADRITRQILEEGGEQILEEIRCDKEL